jgi:hypothetical protein
VTDLLEAAKRKAETTCNAAADTFDAEPLGFWNRSGRGVIARLRLRPGALAAKGVDRVETNLIYAVATASDSPRG